MTLRYIPIALAIFAVQAVNGQKLSTEVVVDRSVDVSLPAASMLPGVVPQSPDKGRTPVLPRTSEYALWADFDPSVGHSSGPDYTGLAPADTLPGYVSLGYLPSYNLGVQAGYRLRFGNTAAKAAVMFDGMSYKSKVGFSKNSVRRNTLGIILGMSHRFKSRAVGKVELSVGHTDMKNPSYSGESSKQALTTLRATADIARRSADISYKASFTYRYTGLDKDVENRFVTRYDNSPWFPGQPLYGDNFPSYDDFNTTIGNGPVPRGIGLKPAEENLLHFDGRVAYAIGRDVAFTIDAVADMLHSKGYFVGGGQNPDLSDKTSFIVGACPGFEFSYKGIDMRVGLRVDWSINTPGASVHLAPEAGARWRFFDKGALYGTVSGGQRFFTLYDLMQYSVFAPGAQIFSPTFVPFDFEAGLRLGSFGGFSADVFAGYQSTQHAVMPAYGTNFGPMFSQSDIKGFSMGLRLDYSPSKVFEASVQAEVFEKGFNRGAAENLDRAQIVVDSRLTVRPVDRMEISLSHKLRYGRHYYWIAPDGRSQKDAMGNISDLGANVTYRFSEHFSAFCRVNNLLGRQVLVLPRLSIPGITGLVGANLSF